MSSGGWGDQDHHMGTDDEFSNFLAIAGMSQEMQFDFHAFQRGQNMMDRQDDHSDAIMGNPNNPSLMMHNQNAVMSSVGPSGSNQIATTSAPDTDPILDLDAQIEYLQQQKHHHQQRHLQEQRTAYFTHSHSVPPTPQSLEMPPGSGHFYSQHDVFDRNYHQQQRMNEQQDMAFTPLVSPAVTPLDPHFTMESGFTVPSAYFSPLTSPALHAQNDSGSGYGQISHPGNSAIEMDLETEPAPVANAIELARRSRKTSVAKSRTKTGMTSSPISKPQRKKPGPSPAIVSQVLSEFDERNSTQAADSNLLPLPAASTDTSEDNASVSPENLSDMPPPPIPTWRSASKSPYIQSQNSNGHPSIPTTVTTPALNPTPTAGPSGTDQLPHPATPASLMRLPASKAKHPATNQHEQTATDNIESLELPESVSNRHFAPIRTQVLSRDSPRIEPGPANLRSYKPLSSPSIKAFGTPSAATQSPQIHPGSTGPSARKTPKIAPRTSRNRAGSVHASPALLPRISPHIKPLLPGSGELDESDASLLLASKSNYQNILEGNRVPGVTYPSELSSNLTSKRTSHKIAEQGRRNRINSAIQLMATLLPDSQTSGSGDTEDNDKKDTKDPNLASSKASSVLASKATVVEKAIVHMRRLQQENKGVKKENYELREELQALKEELEKAKAPA